MKKYLSLSIMPFFFMALSGCNPTPLRTSAPKVNSANNVIVNGQNITLQYNAASQLNGFSLSFSNVGAATCDDISIVATSAYGIVPSGATFLPSDSMRQYTCTRISTRTGINIVLSAASPSNMLQADSSDDSPQSNLNFRPWVNNFKIIINQTAFNVSVNSTLVATQTLTRGTQAQMYLNADFTGCGLNGTVLQRLFDCSKQITNYGVTISSSEAACASSDAANTCQYYTPFIDGAEPDAYWFVVSCPNTNGSATVPQQSCAWLTPIVDENQPALDTNLSGGNTPTFLWTDLTGYQKRLLYSGKLTNGTSGYTFTAANGFSVANALIYANTTANPGSGASGTPPTNFVSACTSTAIESVDLAVRDIISSNSGVPISWKMPSYPMINILTGGIPVSGFSLCPSLGRPGCDVASGSPTNRGFNAVNVPGFSNSTVTSGTCGSNPTFCPEFLWSSSTSAIDYQTWYFNPRTYNGGAGGGMTIVSLFVLGPDAGLGVRCVSETWY